MAKRTLVLNSYEIGLIVASLAHYEDDIHNQIVTCPDPDHCQVRIAELEKRKKDIQQVHDRMQG